MKQIKTKIAGEQSSVFSDYVINFSSLFLLYLFIHRNVVRCIKILLHRHIGS